MGVCPKSDGCAFHANVEASLVKRIRFASAFPYCKGGRHDECALHRMMADGRSVPSGLLPDGGEGDYVDSLPSSSASSAGRRFLVVDDSPVFATLAANAIRDHVKGCEVQVCSNYSDAEGAIRGGNPDMIVSGFGVGGGKTVFDVRQLTQAPIVVFTGRPCAEADLPHNARLVRKDAGPEALRMSIDVLLAV